MHSNTTSTGQSKPSPFYPGRIHAPRHENIKDFGQLRQASVVAEINAFHLDGSISLHPTSVYLGYQQFARTSAGFIRDKDRWSLPGGSILGSKWYYQEDVEEAWYELAREYLARSATTMTPGCSLAGHQSARTHTIWLFNRWHDLNCQRTAKHKPMTTTGPQRITLPRLRVPRPGIKLP
jgi:hypothetical protein